MQQDKIKQEIARRRTFAIISHPDAGKTTLTEKLLLYGGAINLAGSVKGKKNARHAVSDWMDIEKQRGISVTSSAMQFTFGHFCINILDTPGHRDFSEDTYRTLMAADSAVMVIDASKGVENQTRKLFQVCVLRQIPIFTFINKMDREARNPFDLLEEIEQDLGIATYPVTWPIGCGRDFKGVFHRHSRQILKFSHGQQLSGIRQVDQLSADLDDPSLAQLLGNDLHQILQDDVELLDGASHPFDPQLVSQGKLSPVFFGSALTNFGVEPFLRDFLSMTSPPLPRSTPQGLIDPFSPHFSAFVFKIQANMNKAHRDRIAFLRICSGAFEKGMEVLHVQGKRKMKLAAPQQLMAENRENIDEAFAGDVIGVFDPGVFSIGDTVCAPSANVCYEGIPTFAPEHFASVRPKDTLKRKQFVKGVLQIAQEGAIQIFHNPGAGMEEVIVGVVGTLQFDVFTYRMQTEYNVSLVMEALPYQYLRWITSPFNGDEKLDISSDTRLVSDYRDRWLLLFTSQWNVRWALDKNPQLTLAEFSTGDFSSLTG